MSSSRSFPQRLPFYYGWINVLMAAVAMIATFPGRTFGLGLIQRRLIDDLQITELDFTGINLQSSLLGALFCLPMGYFIDRFGVRSVSAVVIGLLALSVVAMAQATGPGTLLLALIFVRGLGQTSLSIVSMAMIGKWFRRRLGLATGVYTVLLTFGFISTIVGLGVMVGKEEPAEPAAAVAKQIEETSVARSDTSVRSSQMAASQADAAPMSWRTAWIVIAAGLGLTVPLTLLLVRNTPESCGVEPDAPIVTSVEAGTRHRDYTVFEAIRTPAFWVFVLGTSAFNLVFSAMTLLNESVMKENGFSQKDSVVVMAYLTGIGLIANFVAGALARRDRLGWLLGLGLAAMAGCLAWFPSIHQHGQLWMYSAVFGFVGGLVTVVHFIAWGNFFGRSHLGRIQGVAQVISVFASATGPELMALSNKQTGSYHPILYVFAGATAVNALAAFLVRPPRLIPVAESDPVAIDPVPGDTPVSPFLQPAQE